MTTTSLATNDDKTAALATEFGLTVDDLEVLRKQIAPGIPDGELRLYLYRCKSLGADPLAKMIYPIPRKQKKDVPAVDGAGRAVLRNGEPVWTKADVMVWTFQSSIDFFRSTAESSEEYDGQDEPVWCGADGQWVDVWLKKEPPSAAKVTVYRKGSARGVSAVALWTEYAQTWDGKPTGMWKNMPALMLAKCAEALALRKAFPKKLGGIYSSDEMGQALSDDRALPENGGKGDEKPAPERKGRNAKKGEAQAALPPPALPPAKQLSDRYREIVGDPEAKLLKWISEIGLIDFAAREKGPNGYTLSDEDKKLVISALDTLEQQLAVEKAAQNEVPPEDFEDAEFSDASDPADEPTVPPCAACGATPDEGHKADCPTLGGACAACARTPDELAEKNHRDGCPEAPPKGDSSKAQHAKIAMLGQDLQMTDKERHELIHELFPPCWSATELSKPQATKLIDHMNKMLATVSGT